MPSKKKSGSRFQQIVSILCVLSMLMSSMPYSMAFASIETPTGEEPERVRSNRNTRIAVVGPSDVHINTCSGNLFYRVPILTIPARGIPLEIFMSYNRGWHDFETHYGYGWQLSYNMFSIPNGTYHNVGPTAKDDWRRHGTGSGGDGGVESKSLKNVTPSYFRKPDLSNPNKTTIPAAKTMLLSSISSFFLPKEAFAGTTNWQAQSDPLVALRDILPTEGPAGTEAVHVDPSGPLIEIQVNDFIDKIYVGSGSWFAFDDSASGGSSSVTLTLPNCAEAPNLTSNDYILTGCAEITGTVGINGWVGMARTLNPNDSPIDVSQYHALTFFAKGDGKSYRVGIETESVRQLDSTDFHQFVFTTSPEWRQFVIPFSSFSQRGWDPTKLVPFTAKDVITVAWSSVGDPLESINLAVDRVAFVNSTLISETTALPDIADVAGPYTVTTHVTDESSIDIVHLFFSLDSGTTFTSVTMMLVSDYTFSASIPGQPLGTEVWYYIEATDTHGNIATDPVDIPCTTYRFQVSERPYLLVDDFVDTNPVNVLGGNSGPYGADSGSSILVHYDEGHVQLDYDVSVTSSYAGYYTLLSEANLTPYSAVTFMIKGAAGGEKVRAGLRDNSLNETKIVIGEYLPGGITTSWQKVTIPLVAFTRVVDWGSMENFNVDFENRIDSGAGIIYLDDIKFEYIAYIPVVVDNFNDMTGENGVGGWLWTWSGGGASINTDYDQTNRLGDSGAGYRISYSDVTGSAWALAVMDLAGLNASNYQTLSFYIKGADGGEQPNIYFVSKTDETEIRGFVDIEDYITVTSSWQRVNIPLEVFEDQGVDLSNLAYFQSGFEWEEMAGTIYLDNITIGSHDYDADGDGDVDGLDLVTYINTHEDFSDLSSFATVFGTTY